MKLSSLPAVSRLIDLALEEDLGRGDVTTSSVVGDDGRALRAEVVAREAMVIFGLEIAAEVFGRVDPSLAVTLKVDDGAALEPGAAALVVDGRAASVLAAERTVLNFLQRLSGVATSSRRFADAVRGTSARVVDTRKTTPGYRALEKAAVLAGGCRNHRADLGSGILIKDNHIAAVGSVTAAVRLALERAPHSLRVEVEVDDTVQLDEALAAGAHVVLLDNMSPDQVREAAARAHRAGALVEVSGGITLDTVASYAGAGADFISVGALTHSAPAVDLGLDVARETA